MTLQQLKAEREKLLGLMSQPRSLTNGETSMAFRDVSEIREAIRQIDADIKTLEASPTVFRVQTNRGI